MKYDFDRVVDRRHTHDIKWHAKAVEGYLHVPVPEEMLPMWLADMDIPCPPHVVKAMKQRCEQEIFGYCAPMEDFMDAVCFWQEARHNFTADAGWMGTIPSVVAGINVAIRAFTDQGDGVIIQQPVYDPFAAIVERCGRKAVNNALLADQNYYTMDYELLEKQAASPENKLMVLCSPHNPVGRVWKAEELLRAADICIRNHVLLVVDEIHADLVFYRNRHVPLLSLKDEYKDHVIMLTSPGKTFNVAGLKMAVSLIPNAKLRRKFDSMVLDLSLDIKNTFGIESVVHCYTREGAEWLNELLIYIQGNFEFVAGYIREHLPGVTFVKPEGTYLIWLDFTDTGISDAKLMKDILLGTGVICVPGTWFGPGGEGHIRLNAGCPRLMLRDALERIERALKSKVV